MKRLFIDLDICNKCKECRAACDYFYHPQNNGITSLREYATFATICRHCEEAPCVDSCYHNALERASDGHIRRHKMLCTSCKSCSVACPFGIIFQDFIPYLDSACDYCLGRSAQLPKCVSSCPEKAIEIREVEESLEKDIYFVGEHLAVHSCRWSREDVHPPRKK
ncbi:MAG: 4Fe-4S dicluster domain-containing protein [Candidatus Omnitrophota bacterium]|jgi:carbon-monoxide dehydrogenase iron sulfur subunit|nr:4Fe-4S binding protein [Candidatus Omnitrophota bacterium]MDD5518679.1 4Fe-4S binding protein [Candidatus Omnitrophota bacterium]